MAEVAKMNQTEFNVITLKGKIDFVQPSNNGKTYSEVILPAPDAYSKPSTVKVESRQPLGNVGQEVDVICHINSFVSTFSTNQDKANGRGERSGRDTKTWFIAIDR